MSFDSTSVISLVEQAIHLEIPETGINETSLTGLVMSAIKSAEQMPWLSGIDKKQVVIEALRKIITLYCDPEDKTSATRDTMLFLVDTLVPPLIDTIINVDKRKVVVHLAKTWWKICC